MNEKYIQALILGTIIGFAIIIDDFIAPKQNHKMMQKHLMVKDIKRRPYFVSWYFSDRNPRIPVIPPIIAICKKSL